MVQRLPDGESAQEAPLIGFVRRGLQTCWMPERQLFSYRYRLEGRRQGNESRPSGDAYYSLNVLLGLARLPDRGGFPVPDIFRRATDEIGRYRYPLSGLGMALWAAGECEQPLSDALLRRVNAIANGDPLRGARAQDLGLLLSGCVAQARHDRFWAERCRHLRRVLEEGFDCPSGGLFYDAATGYRRNFVSFAGLFYLALALYQYGEWADDADSIERANRCVDALVAVQGPQGEWPWFFHAPSGRAVDYYEIYSVHQDGMAPVLLQYAHRHSRPGARAALVRGFDWILGRNQLRRSMLVPGTGLIYRSQRRRADLGSHRPRAVRAVAMVLSSRAATLADPRRVVVRWECRSYHLGWVLRAFAGRTGYPEIVGHAAFAAAE